MKIKHITNPTVTEGLRDPADNPCWKGYHPVGTKKKDGRTVPNCVPNANEGVTEGGNAFMPGIENTPEYKKGFTTGKLPVPYPEGSQQYVSYYKGVMDKAGPKGVAEGSEERGQNRLWTMITDYEQRAKATKNNIKKAHYLKMASELRGKLKTSDEQGVAEGYDKWGWHTSVINGEFMPTKYGNKAYVYLHDMDNQSANGNPQLVTFNKPAHAKKAAAQFGGKVVKTDLNTYRIVKPAEQGVAEGKIRLSTDPNWYGAEVGDYKASGPVVNIPTNRLVGFEPDDKMNQPASKANVEKIVAGLKQGAKLPPLLVRQYKNGYQVLDGHHRFWAYKLLGVKSIPAQVVPAEDVEEVGKQGVAEGVNDYLWHGSKVEHDILYPQQANDTGGKEESNKNAVYATPNAKVAIAMGLTTPGSDTGMFPNDPQMVLFSGNIRKGQMVYLHKVPKDLFIKHNSREWYSKPGVEAVKPIEVVKVPVDQWLHLIRQATPQDLELRKKYMKQGVAEGDISQLEKDVADAPVEPIANMEGIADSNINDLGADAGEYDYEGDMAKDDLETIVRAARQLTGMISDNENMPEWVQSKINKAADYVDTAADYMASNQDEPVDEAKPEKIGGRHDPQDFDDMVSRLKKLAGAGPMKTVYDPNTRRYKNMPTAVQPGDKK